MAETPQAHVIFNRDSAKPAPFKGVGSEIWRWMCSVYLKASGWKIEGDWPQDQKVVLVAAPHTSNWDGVNMLAAAGFYRIDLRWMGKKELTEGVFGGFLKWMGCVPVDRKQGGDMVRQMRDAFESVERMVLAVPPEATRAISREWKSGFYHIAHTARVPILLSVLDYGSKTIRLSGMIAPSGDYEADLKLIKSHYADAKGRRNERFHNE